MGYYIPKVRFLKDLIIFNAVKDATKAQRYTKGFISNKSLVPWWQEFLMKIKGLNERP